MKKLGILIFCLSLCSILQVARADETAATEADSSAVQRAMNKNCNCNVDDNRALTDDQEGDIRRAEADLPGSEHKENSSGPARAVSEPGSQPSGN